MAGRGISVRRVKASTDPQVEQMVTDPAAYFAQARAAARREAHNYVAKRARPARTA